MTVFVYIAALQGYAKGGHFHGPLFMHCSLLTLISSIVMPMQKDAARRRREDCFDAGVTGNPLILGVGQLIERKGWEYTVRCMPAIITRFPEAKLLIVGPSQPAEPAFRQYLMQLATELGVIEHIQILQDNTPEFIRDAYRSATILTHPSFVESFGMVLLEAMTAGVPVVAHNGTGIPCVIDDGVTGYVVDVHDVPKYTDALLSLLGDATLRQRMGAEGRRQAATRFGQAEIAAQLFAVYAEVIGSTENVATQTAESLEKTVHT